LASAFFALISTPTIHAAEKTLFFGFLEGRASFHSWRQTCDCAHLGVASEQPDQMCVVSPSCYRGSINLEGRKQALRNLIAVSTSLHANGSAGRTFILHLGPDTRELAWATLVSFLGLPADPRWSGPILEAMWAEKKIRLLDGIGCTPAAIHGTRDELLARLGQARSLGLLPFPEKNGAVLWPRYTIGQALEASSLASC
jgi:hypothetical protein